MFPFQNEIFKYGKELSYIEKIGKLCNRIYRLVYKSLNTFSDI